MAFGDQPIDVMVLTGLLLICTLLPTVAVINFTGEKGVVEMMLDNDVSSLFYLIFLMALIPIQLALALGLWVMKSWARTGTILFAIAACIISLTKFNLIGLVGVVLGVAASIIVVWYLLKEEVAEAFIS